MLATYFICYYLVNGERVYSTVVAKLLSMSVGGLHRGLVNVILVQLGAALVRALCLYWGYAVDAHPRGAAVMA